MRNVRRKSRSLGPARDTREVQQEIAAIALAVPYYETYTFEDALGARASADNYAAFVEGWWEHHDCGEENEFTRGRRTMFAMRSPEWYAAGRFARDIRNHYIAKPEPKQK